MCISLVFYSGAIGVLLVCALFISLYLLKFLDLSCEGSYALGCMSFCAMNAAGYNDLTCFVVAIISGLLCGLFTAILRCYLNIPKIMCGLMTLAISIAIIHESELKPSVQYIISSFTIVNIIIAVLSVAPIVLLFRYIISSEYGLRLRAFSGKDCAIAKRNLDKYIAILPGLAVSNGIVALAGALSTQLNTNMSMCYSGCGVFLFAMTVMLLGERAFNNKVQDISSYFTYLVSMGGIYRIFLEVISTSCSHSSDSFILIISVSILLIMYGVTITQPKLNSKIISMTLDD